MMYILFFLGAGIAVQRVGYPLQFAAVVVAVALVESLLYGASAGSLAFSGAITYAYTAFVYLIVEAYSDKVVLPILIVIGGILVWVGASIAL